MVTGDEDLLKLVAQGDSVAFAQLYDRFAPRVFGLALKLVHDRQAAQDILQDVFLELWRRAPSFDASIGTAPAWILMIARSRSIDSIRKRMRERTRLESLQPAAAAGGPTVADTEWLARTIPGLAPDLREVVHLAYAQGLTREQIAQALGIPVGTVKTRLRTAVTQMTDLMTSERRAAR